MTYDLSRAVYKPRKTINGKSKRVPVKIRCPDHGWINASSESLLAGRKPLCCSHRARGKKMTKPEADFIRDCELKHGENRYDLSNLNYKNTKSRIRVTCKRHDPEYTWEPFARSFQSGDGCPKCYGFNKDTEDFKAEASILHNHKYTYERTVYIRGDKPIIITCPEHGDWDTTTPNGHLRKNRPKGCPICGELVRIGKVTKSTKQFILDAIQKHGPKRYDYSKVDYKNSKTDVQIICKNHGVFSQKPGTHLQGKGCPVCGEIAKSWDSLENIFDQTREQNFEPCNFYIFELKRFPGFFKPGISKRTKDRVDEEYAKEPLIQIGFNTRQEARLVELVFLKTTCLKIDCPEELREKKWRGYSEVRRANSSDLEHLAFTLKDELWVKGPRKYAFDRLGYNPKFV